MILAAGVEHNAVAGWVATQTCLYSSYRLHYINDTDPLSCSDMQLFSLPYHSRRRVNRSDTLHEPTAYTTDVVFRALFIFTEQVFKLFKLIF